MFRTNKKALTAMGPRQVFSSKRQYTMNVAVERKPAKNMITAIAKGPDRETRAEIIR